MIHRCYMCKTLKDVHFCWICQKYLCGSCSKKPVRRFEAMIKERFGKG